jgi:hypothetical protein
LIGRKENMSETGLFELATEIMNKIALECDDTATSQKLMHLIRELLEIRWSISLGQSVK